MGTESVRTATRGPFLIASQIERAFLSTQVIAKVAQPTLQTLRTIETLESFLMMEAFRSEHGKLFRFKQLILYPWPLSHMV